jgi:hypothetical protein
MKLFTQRERTIAYGRCLGPEDHVPAIGAVGLDKKADCPVCGKRVAVTVRGRFAHHWPAKETTQATVPARRGARRAR